MPAINSVIIEALVSAGRSLLRPPRAILIASLVISAVLTSQAAQASITSASSRPVAAVQLPPFSHGPLSPAEIRPLIDGTGNLQPFIDSARAVLRQARDEAAVASFLRLPVSSLNRALERYGAMLDSSDPAERTAGMVGVRQYSELIHSLLLSRGPARLIVVSLEEQRLVAYDRGTVVLATPVTTGRAELVTDVGAMRVLSKDSPWKMTSPWPRQSPFWYPDTQVQMVIWFTNSGEGFHDAPWEPASAFGPGSQNGPFASHGCVHLPSAAEATLYQWAQIGTPVVVIPGDGTPAEAQLAQQSVDGAGNPIGGARGD